MPHQGNEEAVSTKERSIWRETIVMVNLLRVAINPSQSLFACLESWDTIVNRLMEPTRKKRQSQSKKLREGCFG